MITQTRPEPLGVTEDALEAAGRRFLDRASSTQYAGIICSAGSAAIADQVGARTAIRIGRRVYEAIGDERLHAQITLRVQGCGIPGPIEDGWTFPLRPVGTNTTQGQE